VSVASQSLSQSQRASLSHASPEAVIDAAAGIRRYLVAGRWIGTNNVYLRAPVKVVEKEVKAGATTASNPKHLREYVAASTVLHAAEGWSYLGRALVSHAAGNADVARHLGYYAELRAAMSILATQGIGIFHRSHAVLTASSVVRLLKGFATHEMTWLALEAWATSTAGADAMTTAIRPEGSPIAGWIGSFGAAATGRPLGQSWLKEWGLDLRRFTEDRNARNEVSYRPGVRPHPATSSEDGAEFLRQFWPLFEPRESEPFGIVDRYLLRCSLDAAFAASPSNTVSFRQRIERALREQADAAASSALGGFLLRTTEPDEPLLLTYARDRATQLSPNHHMHVMSRAALLLRLSTGMVSSVLRQAEIEFDELRFWFDRVVDGHGLAAPGDAHDDPLDMWADVRDALEDLEGHIDSGGAGSYWNLGHGSASALAVLGGAERIGLWALA